MTLLFFELAIINKFDFAHLCELAGLSLISHERCTSPGGKFGTIYCLTQLT